MNLSNVVPWGRTLAEYKEMFSLTREDLQKSILGCGDGPASFNFELTAQGGNVTSIDPTYCFSEHQLRSRISEVYDEIMPQMYVNRDSYIWENISSVEELGTLRMAAMNAFIEDYERGRAAGRYVEASLPNLEFPDNFFELALCSHYLFLYSEQVSLAEHIDSLIELCRVAREVRVYPLLALNGVVSPHLDHVIDALGDTGLSVSFVDVAYQFQKGATQMLVLGADH